MRSERISAPKLGVVGAFVPWRAAALIAVTGTLGYALGWVAGTLWNAVQRKKPASAA